MKSENILTLAIIVLLVSSAAILAYGHFVIEPKLDQVIQEYTASTTPLTLDMHDIQDDTTGAVMQVSPDFSWRKVCEAQKGTYAVTKDGSWNCNLTKTK